MMTADEIRNSSLCSIESYLLDNLMEDIDTLEVWRCWKVLHINESVYISNCNKEEIIQAIYIVWRDCEDYVQAN